MTLLSLEKTELQADLSILFALCQKDDFRYQYLVFLDEENGLLLRGDMLDREGKLT